MSNKNQGGPSFAHFAKGAQHLRWLGSLVIGLAVLGCGSLPGRPKPGPEVPRPDEVVDFPTLYTENCSGCHGEKGMNGPAYPLANSTYQALVDEQHLRQIIAHGESGTLMPAFAISAGGSLTDQQVDALVNGMRTAWNKGSAVQGAPPYRATGSVQSAHGPQVYEIYCASCHGAAGASGKSKAGSITAPAFLALISDQALRTIVIAGRPDIGQPDWRNDSPGHPMSDQEVTEVVGWLAGQRTAAPATTPRKSGGS